jgi:Domain of unknown function (DUF932)
MTIDNEHRFNVLADRLALEQIIATALERRVLRHLWVIDKDTGARARAHGERAIEQVLATFHGGGSAGDTSGNSPGSKWVAFNAIAEHLDYGRRYTTRGKQEATDTRSSARRLSAVSSNDRCARSRVRLANEDGRRWRSAGGGRRHAAVGQGQTWLYL